MNDDIRAKRNEIIYRCFRDNADGDYIAARTSHRMKLFDQFLWSALQAIEKYLKTILLLYDRDTRDLGHNLCRALERVKNISDIEWDFEDGIHEFLEFLTFYGADRYFTFPRETQGNELFLLDYAVWKIRRYCQDFQWLKNQQEELGINIYNKYIQKIQSRACQEKSNRFRLNSRGHLEKVLDTKRFQKQRDQLVYINFYFGSYKKKIIRAQITITSAYPPHFRFPEVYSWMEQHVKLSPRVRRHFESDN